MACLKFLAKCLCPRCEVLKVKVHLLGSKSDDHARNQLRRDSTARRVSIHYARRAIYEVGKGVKSVFIERILQKSESPNQVSFTSQYIQ